MNQPTPDQPVSAQDTPCETVLWLTWQDLYTVVGLCSVNLLLVSLPVAPSAILDWAGSPAAVSTEYSPLRIDINSATEDELQLLSGIGPALAQRIVEERNQNGPIQDLDRIRGIGPKLIAKNRRFMQTSKPSPNTATNEQ